VYNAIPGTSSSLVYVWINVLEGLSAMIRKVALKIAEMDMLYSIS
jgi:hypothetical protein